MVSIIVPLYNKESTIGRCLDSVINQTCDNWECLIIDDGSRDNSAQMVQKYKNQNVAYYYKKNGGVSSARNYGVSLAKGDFILFLDADDYLDVRAIENLTSTINNYSTDCVCGNFYVQKNNHTFVYSYMRDGLVKNPFKQWYKQTFCPRTGAAMFPKKVLIDYPFKENLSRYEDAESLFNIMRKYSFSYTSTPVMTYTDDNKGLSSYCKEPDRDFVFHMDFNNKSFWEKLILAKMLKSGYHGYPNQRRELKAMYPCTMVLLVMDSFLSFFFKISGFFKKRII